MPPSDVVLIPSVRIDQIPPGVGGVFHGPTITLTGTADCRRQTPTGNVSAVEAIFEVAVRFGGSGDLVAARPTGLPRQGRRSWSTWTTDSLAIAGVENHNLRITARVLAGRPDDAIEATTAVTLAMSQTPPVLTIRTPVEMTQAVKGGRTTFDVAGTTETERSPVVAVEHQFDDGPFVLAIPEAPNVWSSWKFSVTVSPAGTHSVAIKAADAEGNVTPAQHVILKAVETFHPRDSDDPFSRAAFLFDLLGFAKLRMVDARGAPLTAETLTSAYHHRFNDLSDPNNREAATATVLQLRVCVEVLRAFLGSAGKSAPPAEEAKYRQGAYAALLRYLGTSFDEMRQSRGDEGVRARLAARLGLDRSDRLDSLLLLPDQVTEARLEQLFGLQDTTRDPLARGPQPLLLTAQLARLRAQWQELDDAARVYDDVPVPIIDPHLLTEFDFRTRNKDADPAFALWSARIAETDALTQQIDNVRRSESNPLAGFGAVVNQFVTRVEDLTALLADYQAGKDIGARLVEKRLDVAAFLRLIRTRDLAAADTVLDVDWADVYGIAAQVNKLGRYAAWRAEERARGLILGPDYFVLPDATAPPVDLPQWRATPRARRAWQVTLQTRIGQQQVVIESLRSIVDAAEADTLPGLRDLLVATAGDAARGLLIDLAAGRAQTTTRLDQAIETIEAALFAGRAGASGAGQAAAGLTLAPDYAPANFDADWVFWGSHETWQGAMRVFAYPESHLLPSLRPDDSAGETTRPTKAYKNLIGRLRSFARITPEQARASAADYLAQLRADPSINLPPELRDPVPRGQSPIALTERLTDTELATRQAISLKLMKTVSDPHLAANHLQEIFYFVPLLCAVQLQRSGEFLAALDWFRTVYAYHLPPGRVTLEPGTLPADKPAPDRRQIYYGLTLDEQTPTRFERDGNWPRVGLNPHDIVHARANALVRFTVFSLVRCFETFADAEFTRDTDEAVARARALYQTALDVLTLTYPPSDSAVTPAHPFGLAPSVEALRLHAESNLRKLRLGRNIAGLERQRSSALAAGAAVAPRQPTPYRYAALVARAKELAQTASQMEAALLAALEKRDGESYNLLKATQDVELACATKALHDLRVQEATDGKTLAVLQKGRAEIQFDHFNALINDGVNRNEKLALGAEALGVVLSGGAGLIASELIESTGLGVLDDVFKAFGQGGSVLGGVGSLFSQFATHDRREEEWRLNRSLAAKDKEIGDQQILIATDQFNIATQEQTIAGFQRDHAAATVQFLAGKFTNVELYEFMSEVLDGVYRFFLQQATALAKLAENQLAFERQEPPQGVIQGDYYAPPDGSADRRGITGSARLLADIIQLDQHAFLTDRRKLQLTKTVSLARLAPIEFARFRETGVLMFGTPQELFDRDFPGHYLRQVKRARISLVALTSPGDGIRATLSTSGTSRVVIGGDTFRTAVVRRDPETVGLSSPRDATGLFELVPDSQPELLLPFEGSGVDAVWRFELPKAANPFDFSTIADVLLTLEYSALNSFDYRQQVVQTLDPEVTSDRPFSFRQQFPDQWYDLNNPDQSGIPMTVRITTTRGDFLPNVDDLRIRQLVLYLAPARRKPVDVRGARLLFKKEGGTTSVGGSADSIDGVISTRRPNGSNWLAITGDQPPIGEWELALPTDERFKKLFRDEEIADILFVITYSGRTPAWPE